MPRGLFIAGTSTDVGKTFVGAQIARALHSAGRRVGVYKPVASGCLARGQFAPRIDQPGDELVADDAVTLWEAAGRPLTLEQACPQRFRAPLAPPRAAALEGRQVDEALLRTGLGPWLAGSEIVLVEGAGGLMSPLSDRLYNIDLAGEFGFPLVIVAANRLGVINDVLQTLITARACAPRLPVAGIVLNQAELRPGDASLDTNAEEIRQRCDAPLLATAAHGDETALAAIDWYALADPARDALPS